MKNMIHIRNSVIIILCITVIFLAVGFIILSVKLKNKTDEVYTLNTVFTDISKTSSVKGSDKEPKSKAEIITSGSEINMSFNMNAAHDEITYVAKIKNKGSLPCEIVDIMESPDYKLEEFKKNISPVTISLTDIKGKIIPPGEELDLKIVVYYNTSTSGSKNFSYKIGLITKSR